MESISSLMLNEHVKIRKLILKLLEEIKTNSVFESTFKKFKWNLEKHLFLEEKAIFYIYQKIKGQEITEIFDLMQEHEEINSLLSEISESYNNKNSIEDLAILLERHAKYEDKTLYPYLDEYLNENQKAEVIARIKEVVV